MAFLHYKTLNKYKTTLQATKSQCDIPSLYAGQQCVAIGAMAIATSTFKSPEHWTPKTLDKIIEKGHDLYTYIRATGIQESF